MEKKTKRFLKKCPKRAVSLLLCVVLIGLMFPSFVLQAHAAGTISEYEIDGMEYFVEWGDEWGEGTAFFYCEYCQQGFGREFSDGDHEGCVSDMIDEDILECGHCTECKSSYHCYHCGSCPEMDGNECPFCNSLLCIDCHKDDYYCDICGNCRLEDGADGEHLTGHNDLGFPGLDAICGDCYEATERCDNCANVTSFGGGEYIVAEAFGVSWCAECNLCRVCVHDQSVLVDYGHCAGCGVCGSEENVCEECHYCDNCIAEKESHCPECDECFGDKHYEQCEEGGEHCILDCGNNDWICSLCGECVVGNGTEFCSDCGFCVECCFDESEATGCTHGYCVKSSAFEEHLCPDCGECPQDTECEYCGYCETCAEEYHCEHEICPENEDEWEEHLCDNCGNCFELDELCDYCHMCEGCWEHCQHELCPEESEYDDHICDNCGECFEEDEFCEYCQLCPTCCEDNTLDMDCDHELCVESGDFADHYCFEHFQCLEYCDHNEDCEHEDVSSTWSKNGAAHWHKCLLCGGSADASPHIAGDPVLIQEPDILTRTMGIAQISCKVCGQKMEKVSIPYTEASSDGSPYILSQPKDYEGRVSFYSSYEEDCALRYAAFTVIAGGLNNHYQWYYRVNGGAAKKLTDELGAEEYYEMSGNPAVEGSTKNRLIVMVDETSCHNRFEYWCVVTNAKGSVKTRYAQLASAHDFGAYQRIDADTHIQCCRGDGCDATRGHATEHRFTPWQVDYPATTTAKGQEHRMCHDCYYYETAPIQKIEEGHVHNYVKYGYSEDYHWKQCMCGKTTVASEHYFPEDWKIVREPTEHKTGLRVRTCHTCFYDQYETIAKLPHTHNFTSKRDNKKGRFDAPNGRWDEDYHYVNCADKNCTSWHREKHTYHAWNVMHLPFTDRKGDYHAGLMYRKCSECGHCQQIEFNAQWPIATEVFNYDSTSGFGGAVITGPTSANAGSTITLTVELQEGFIPDTAVASANGWSLNEVTSNDGIYFDDKFYPYKNESGGTLRQTFKTDATTYSATFTMPDGPVALAFFVRECDHKGARTHRDTIEPTCTGYGATVDRCNRCNAIVKELSRTDPKGHLWGFNRWIQRGDCNTLDIYEQKCIYCGKTREHDDGYHHMWFSLENAVEPSCHTPGHKTDVKCGLCDEYLYGETIKAIGHHNWGSWVVTKQPTNTTKGERYRECKRCGNVQMQIMDYVGEDYELRPDQKTLKFSFTYGDEAVPQYINFTSVGRNEIKKITSVNLTDFGQDAAYTAELVGDMTVKITPNMGAIWGYTSDDVEHLVVTGTDAGDAEVEMPEICISSTIKKSPEKYNLTVDGGTIEWEKTYTTRKGASVDAYAGSEVIITAKNGADFDHWEVIGDSSGLIAQQLDAAASAESRQAYIMLPQNNVSLRAVYRTLSRIDINDLFLPVAGASPRFDVTYNKGLFTVERMRWVQSDNGHELTSSETFLSGKKYYAELFLKPKSPFILNGDALKNSVYLNGSTELVDSKWTKPYSQEAGWYLVTTNDISVTSARTITSFDVAISKPVAGYTLSYSPTLSTKYVELPNQRQRVVWYDNNGGAALSTGELVKEGHSYVVYIKLSAQNGYQFLYDGSDRTVVTVNGNPVPASYFTGTATSATLRYDFIDEYAIYDLKVTGITEPVAGQAPSYTATVPADGHYKLLGTSGKRKNGIMWQDENGNYFDPNDPSAKFEKGKQYSCLVFLEPDAAEYHIAKDICTGSINGNKAEVLYGTLANRYLWLKYTFTCAAGALIGDSNLDGSITISDVTEIQKYLAELVDFSDEQLLAADTNGDGSVDISDATHLQKYLAEFDGIVLGKPSA